MFYKTGQMFDQVKIINLMVKLATYYDTQVYALADAAGSILKIILSPVYPRVDYTE
jgi:hypothetical protein